jgi:glucose-6-phosphate isomerase
MTESEVRPVALTLRPDEGRLEGSNGRYEKFLTGEEYAMTRGPCTALADRSELYVGLSGRGVMIFEALDGRSQVVEFAPGARTTRSSTAPAACTSWWSPTAMAMR